MNIIHAGGDIDGICATNSLESILLNIEHNVNKVFEVDVVKIKDGYVIAHDYLEESYYNFNGKFTDITFEYYKTLKVKEKYTPMDFYKLKSIMNKHNDYKFILDIKNNDDDYKNCLIYIKSIFNNDIDNLIPQIYFESDLNNCIEAGFKCCHLALWKREARGKPTLTQETIDFINRINLIAKNKISIFGISIWYKHYSENAVSDSKHRFINIIPPVVESSSQFDDFFSKLNNKVYLHGQGATLEDIYTKINSRGIGFFRGAMEK